MTLGPLTESLGAESLTWYLAGFPARTSVALGEGTGSTASAADSGANSPGSLARYDPATHSLRTAQCLLFEEGTECLRTLPRWGFLRAGELFPLPTPEPLTGERGSGFVPTPQANEIANPNKQYRSPTNAYYKDGRKCQPMLADYVRIWPTPTARDHKDGSAESCANVPENCLLGRAVHVRWTTPMTTDACKPCMTEKRLNRPKGIQLREQVGGSLNPTWVEWLMGWPLGWTSLDALAMDRFQQWRRSHGEF